METGFCFNLIYSKLYCAIPRVYLSNRLVPGMARYAFKATMLKQCDNCKRWKLFTEFNKKASKKDGLNSWCKVCTRERNRQWKKDNAEKAHSQKLAQDKRYYLAHPERVAESRRKWRAKNPEKVQKQKTQWYKLNPLKAIEYFHTHKARKMENGGKITAQEWQALKEFYNFTCLCCKRREPQIKLELDHVVPLALGGKHSISNIQPLCRSCNASKHTKHIDYRPWWNGRLF